MEESGTDEVGYSRKVASGSRVGGDIRSLVNARSLQLECVRVLHESLLVPVLTYGRMRRRGLELGLYRWTTSEVTYGRRRGQELGLYRWTTSEVCWVSGECIVSNARIRQLVVRGDDGSRRKDC